MPQFPATQAKLLSIYVDFLSDIAAGEDINLDQWAACEAENWLHRDDIERMHLEDIEEAWYGDDQAAVDAIMEQYRLHHPELYAEFFHVIDPATRGSKIEYVPPPVLSEEELAAMPSFDDIMREAGFVSLGDGRYAVEGGV